MAERSFITQLVQLGMETTPGTAVATTKRLQSLDIESKIMGSTDEFRPQGFKFPTVLATEREWVEMTVKGQPTYTELVYVLSGILNKLDPTGASNPATITDGANTGRLWAFEPKTSSPDAVQTFTVEQGDSVRAHKMVGGIFTDMGITFSREKIEMSGKMIGQRLTDGITLSAGAATTYTGTNGATLTAIAASGTLTVASTTGMGPGGTVTVVASGGTATLGYTAVGSGTTLTGVTLITGTGAWTVSTAAVVTQAGPTSVALVPVQANQITVYLDTTSGGIGTTKIADAGGALGSRLMSGEFSLANRFGPFWPVDASFNSYAGTVETVPTMGFKAIVEANAAGMGLLTNWRNNTTGFLRIQAVGALITGVTPYKLTIDMAVSVKAPGAFSDNQGLYAIEFDFAGIHDGAWNKALHIEVQNALTGL